MTRDLAGHDQVHLEAVVPVGGQLEVLKAVFEHEALAAVSHDDWDVRFVDIDGRIVARGTSSVPDRRK